MIGSQSTYAADNIFVLHKRKLRYQIENPDGIIELEHGIEPLLITSIGIMRHSESC